MWNTKELRTGDIGQRPAKPCVSLQVRILKDLTPEKSLTQNEKRQQNAGATCKTHNLTYLLF
jgi:hypothetical protein